MYDILSKCTTTPTGQKKKKWYEILDQPDLDWKKVYNLPFKVTKTQNYNGYSIESITIS